MIALLSLKDAAASLPKPVDTATVCRWAKTGIAGAGRLPSVKIGRRIFVKPEALKKWLADQNGGVDVMI